VSLTLHSALRTLEKFVETNAVDMMLLHLKQHSHLTVTGKPGIGKSAAIHHVALLLNKNNGYDVIPYKEINQDLKIK
jgi:ABC-type phosphate/phosphonate transport system ATPase subunit